LTFKLLGCLSTSQPPAGAPACQARIVASGPLQAESAGGTYILVYRAMAKLYKP
jgi:hypothetical protein